MGKKSSQSHSSITRSHISYENISHQQLKRMTLKKIFLMQSENNNFSKNKKTKEIGFQRTKKIKKVDKKVFKGLAQQSTFECPVCLQLMIQPTLLECGHAYCSKCIEELMIYKSSCGVCRNIQTDPQFKRSKFIETIIENEIVKNSENYLNYYCRVTDFINWKKARNVSISQLTKGSFIDFRDKQLKWRKGEINKIQFVDGRNYFQMQIKYKKDGEIVLETINSDSIRYAKYTYYTRMKYLQPKPHIHHIEQRIREQFIYTPLTQTIFQLGEQIDHIFDDMRGETAQSNIEQNIEIDRNFQIQDSFYNFEFINELLQLGNNQRQDFLELLV